MDELLSVFKFSKDIQLPNLGGKKNWKPSEIEAYNQIVSDLNNIFNEVTADILDEVCTENNIVINTKTKLSPDLEKMINLKKILIIASAFEPRLRATPLNIKLPSSTENTQKKFLELFRYKKNFISHHRKKRKNEIEDSLYNEMIRYALMQYIQQRSESISVWNKMLPSRKNANEIPNNVVKEFSNMTKNLGLIATDKLITTHKLCHHTSKMLRPFKEIKGSPSSAIGLGVGMGVFIGLSLKAGAILGMATVVGLSFLSGGIAAIAVVAISAVVMYGYHRHKTIKNRNLLSKRVQLQLRDLEGTIDKSIDNKKDNQVPDINKSVELIKNIVSEDLGKIDLKEDDVQEHDSSFTIN
ncbi:MAG: hypothetical protein HRT87_05920 [Legionellales bacterium]|nr:hypothetical protein [Legionellales bacterium]